MGTSDRHHYPSHKHVLNQSDNSSAPLDTQEQKQISVAESETTCRDRSASLWDEDSVRTLSLTLDRVQQKLLATDPNQFVQSVVGVGVAETQVHYHKPLLL